MNYLSTRCPTALPIPQKLSISTDLAAQQLSVSWLGGAATTFDLIILRTELNETVFFVRTFLFFFHLQFYHLTTWMLWYFIMTACILLMPVPRLSVCGLMVSLWLLTPHPPPRFVSSLFFSQETISVVSNPASGQHQWNWTSAEPLECTSLSVKVRSRDGQLTSKWSDILIHQGQKGNGYNQYLRVFPFFQSRVYQTLFPPPPLQGMTSPATPWPRCTPRTEWCMWGITPPFAALWKRRSALALSSSATQRWPRNWSAGGLTQLRRSTSSHHAQREPTSSVWTSRTLWWAEPWSLLDVRYISERITSTML